MTDLGPDTTCYLPWYEIKSDTGWNALIRLVQQLNHQPQNIEQVLDVDQVLWMHAFNNALLNLDSYAGRLCHNYYVYEDSLGIFHPILWDMNLAFGGFRLDGAEDHPLSDEELAQLSPFLHLKNKNPERPLITQLLATPLYRKMYVAHIKTILEEQLRSGAWEKVLVDVHKRIAPEVSRDSLKLYTQEDFQRNLDSTLQVGGASVPGLRTLLLRRTTHLGDHPLLKKEAPVIQTPVVQKKGNKVNIKIKVNNAQQVHLFVREHGIAGITTRYNLRDDGQAADVTAGDSEWALEVPFQEGMRYFIVAEDDKVASVWPARSGMGGAIVE